MTTFDDSLPPNITALCRRLKEAAGSLDRSGGWPTQQLSWLADAGVFRWFLPERFGGDAWEEQQLVQGYLALSEACLTTTFVLTQWQAACKRILTCRNKRLQERLLPKLAAGELFATVGISHLTTSRQHLSPVLAAVGTSEGGYMLNGYSPWVTGAAQADMIVLGATLAGGDQLLVVVPTTATGLDARPGEELIALSGSCTDQVVLRDVAVGAQEILAGPTANVLQAGTGGGAGGLQTSTLALGLALAAIDFLREQSQHRPDLRPVSTKLAADSSELVDQLLGMAGQTNGGEPALSAADLRQRANSLVLRATQAALTAAKGAGFVSGHPAGRWAREALFFLVWSCPQPVAAGYLCELAHLH